MAVMRYDRGLPRVGTPAITQMPTAIRPMGEADTEAGESAGQGFGISLDFGSTGGTGGGTGSSAAITTAYRTAADRAAARRARRQANYVRGLLSGTGYRAGIDELLGKVGEEEARQLGQIGSQYGTARTNVQDIYGRGAQQTTLGYQALADWLASNAPTAYSQAPRATSAPMENALAAYQRAQQVSTAPTEAALALANVAAEGGAANYNNLINSLAAREAGIQQSRTAEQQMASTVAQNRINAALAQALAGLQAQQFQAEQGVRGQFGQTRLSAEQAAIARRNALQDMLRQLTGY